VSISTSASTSTSISIGEAYTSAGCTAQSRRAGHITTPPRLFGTIAAIGHAPLALARSGGEHGRGIGVCFICSTSFARSSGVTGRKAATGREGLGGQGVGGDGAGAFGLGGGGLGSLWGERLVLRLRLVGLCERGRRRAEGGGRGGRGMLKDRRDCGAQGEEGDGCGKLA